MPNHRVDRDLPGPGWRARVVADVNTAVRVNTGRSGDQHPDHLRSGSGPISQTPPTRKESAMNDDGARASPTPSSRAGRRGAAPSASR